MTGTTSVALEPPSLDSPPATLSPKTILVRHSQRADMWRQAFWWGVMVPPGTSAYARGLRPAVSYDDVQASPIGGSEPLDRVGQIPPLFGRQVLARDAVPVESWSGSLDLCAVHLWLEVGDDQFIGYALLGGP